MAKFTEHFSGTVRSTKDALRHGPLEVRRVNAIPPDTFGRNSDIVIVDDTAESVENIAENRIPVASLFCQKIPLTVAGGTFTITVAAGVFTITIATIDDVVEQINRANIPGVNASIVDRANIFITCPGIVTFADGTSDFPSVTGIAGPNSGELTVATGSWECQVFPASIEVLDEGVSLGQFNALDFVGVSVVATDAGGGEATITVTGGAGGPAYGVIIGDTGTATAVVASETITFGGIGIDVVATNAGAGLDTISFNLDIADLPAGIPPPIAASTIAINVGGTTAEYPISSLSGLFTSIAYSSITGGDGGTATAIGSDTITFNGTGINVVATDAGAGLDTVAFVMDIADLSAGAGPLVDTDEIAVDDGGTTERHSIDDVVDAALPGVAVTTIDGQPFATLIDTTRGNKVLSIDSQPLVFSDKDLTDLEWIAIGDAIDADSSYIADFDGTVVYATGHCENTGGNSKEIHLYINGVDSATLGTLSGGANVTFNNNTLNINFSQDDRIRLRAHNGSGGKIEDTVVKITVKWR